MVNFAELDQGRIKRRRGPHPARVPAVAHMLLRVSGRTASVLMLNVSCFQLLVAWERGRGCCLFSHQLQCLIIVLILFCNPILFAVCTSTFSKLCKNMYTVACRKMLTITPL
jgi:hypothetical protein